MLRKTFAATAAMLVIAMLLSCGQDSSRSPVSQRAATQHVQASGREPSRARVVPGEFLVKFKPRASKSSIQSALFNASVKPVHAFRSVPGLQLVKGDGGAGEQHKMALLAAQADVEYVEPNFVVHVDAVPNDPDYPKQWSLHNVGQLQGVTDQPGPDIEAQSAWDITTGSSDVVMAVIDTGIDYNHPDLAANMFRNTADCNTNGVDDDGNGYIDDCYGIDAVNGDSDPMDDYFHGTHVAGTIGAVGNNGIGIAGVAWNVRLLACKFLDATGTGNDAGAITCLDYIAALKDRGVNIVASNNSWGGIDHSQALSDAIAAQRDRGILLIAAAGNSMTDNDVLPSYPCNYDHSNVICVASAIDSQSIFSNYGTGTVHLGAPGESIYSTMPNNSYDWLDGTSMATPHVTGTIALLKSQDPSRDWRTLKNLVLAGTVPPTQYQILTLTGGRLDAYRSMTCTDSPVLARMRPGDFAPLHRAIGDAVRFEVLHINCGTPAGNVTLSIAPSGESVTLLDDGNGSDEVAGDGIYSGTWTATNAGTFTFSFPAPETDVVTVNVDADLKRGFPVNALILPSDYGVGFASSVDIVVGNVDADADLEIFAEGPPVGPVYAWKSDGRLAPGWPQWLSGSSGSPSLGEFDGDPSSLEVEAWSFWDGILLFDGNGARLPGTPNHGGAQYPPPTIDVDGDGRDEIISFPALHPDGTPLNAAFDVPVIPTGDQGFAWTSIAADVDADDEPDFIAAGSDEQLWVSNRFGLLPGFPAKDARAHREDEGFPVVGDVDGDGKLDIVEAGWEPSISNPTMKLYVFASDGSYERTLHTHQWGGVFCFPALADLDGDGIPEILFSMNNMLFAWKGDGTAVPGWPVILGPNAGNGSPVVGDVNGDGKPDIVILHLETPAVATPDYSAALDVFNADGTRQPGFPKIYDNAAGGPVPALADIDHDGRTDIVVWPMASPGDRESVFVYDLHGAGTYGPIEWGQYMGGPKHTGYYETGKNLPNHAFLTAQTHGEGRITSADGRIDCGNDCIEKYAKGSTTRLTATAGAGATFTGWHGACAGQPNPCTLTVTKFTPVSADFDTPLTVSIAGTGTGHVVSNPAGIDCPADCSQVYPQRASVTLTATADASNQFDGWDGACSGAASTCAVLMTSAKSVTARFVNKRRLTVNTIGGGSALLTTPDGAINCGTTCFADFIPDTTVTLTVTPASDSYLVSWTNCNPFVNTCPITMDRDQSITVTVALKPLVSVAVSGHGRIVSPAVGIDCGTVCSARVAPDTYLELRALPDADSYFSTWGGDCSTNGGDYCAFWVYGPVSVTAEFLPKSIITVTLAGTGSGTVASPDLGINCGADCEEGYAPNIAVGLTATPAAGSVFAGWSGACTGTDTVCSVLTGPPQTVTATFNRSTSGGGGGNNGGGGGGGGGGGVLSGQLLLALGFLLAARATRRYRSEKRIGPLFHAPLARFTSRAICRRPSRTTSAGWE